MLNRTGQNPLYVQAYRYQNSEGDPPRIRFNKCISCILLLVSVTIKLRVMLWIIYIKGPSIMYITCITDGGAMYHVKL